MGFQYQGTYTSDFRSAWLYLAATAQSVCVQAAFAALLASLCWQIQVLPITGTAPLRCRCAPWCRTAGTPACTPRRQTAASGRRPPSPAASRAAPAPAARQRMPAAPAGGRQDEQVARNAFAMLSTCLAVTRCSCTVARCSSTSATEGTVMTAVSEQMQQPWRRSSRTRRRAGAGTAGRG